MKPDGSPIDGVQKYHRTLATLLNELIEAGLSIERVLEPVADEEQLRQRPDWGHEWRPFCLLVRARRSAAPPDRNRAAA
jgi:hypothetical protein